MELDYKSKLLKKLCTEFTAAKNKYEEKIALKLFQRISELKICRDLEDIKNIRFNGFQELPRKSKKQYAVDILGGYLLIFAINKDILKLEKIEVIN